MNSEDKKYWFYGMPVRARVLLIFFLFPIFVPIAVWPLLKFKPVIKYSIIGVWTLLMFTFYFVGGSETPETTIEELKVASIEGIKEGQVFETQKIKIRVKTKPVLIDSLTINGRDVEDEEGIFNTDYLFEGNFEEGNNKALIVAKHGDQEITKEINFKVDLRREKIVIDLLNKKAPLGNWEEKYGETPETLEGTDSTYYLGYLSEADISFISKKDDDVIFFAGFGKEGAIEELNRIKEARKERIEKGFSSWDGSHIKLTEMIKAGMNDKDSYEHVETIYYDNKDHLIVVQTFRGNNAFGAKVKNSVRAKVDLDGNVIEVLEQF